MNATLNALFCAAPNLLTVCNVLYMVLEPQNKGTTRLESKRCRRNREHALQIKGGLFAALLPVTHSAICVLPCVCRCYYRLASAWQKTANPSLQYIFLVTTPYTLTIAIQRPKCRIALQIPSLQQQRRPLQRPAKLAICRCRAICCWRQNALVGSLRCD